MNTNSLQHVISPREQDLKQINQGYKLKQKLREKFIHISYIYDSLWSALSALVFKSQNSIQSLPNSIR